MTNSSIKPLVTVLLVFAASSAPAQPLTPEQTLNRRTIGDLEFSPDSSKLVFTVTEPPNGATRPRAIWLLDVSSGETRQLSFPPEGKADSGPQWSPDGRTIAFLSNRTSEREAVQQLYLLRTDGGEAIKLVDRKESISACRWSRDGREIAFLMADAKPPELEQREKDRDDARVVDKDERHSRIWVVDVESRSLRQITSGKWRIRQIEWLPGGGGFIVSATDRPESDQWTDRLYKVSLPEGRFTEVVPVRGPLGAFDVSPEGRTIAYVGARVDGPEPHDLWTKTLDGGSPTNLTGTAWSDAAFDLPVRQPRWIDPSTLAAIADTGFRSQIVTFTTGGRIERLMPADASIAAYARAQDGTLAFVSETTTRAPDVWLAAKGGTPKKMTVLNQRWASIQLVEPELVHYKSFDGASIEAALLKPIGSAASTQPRAPLVVLVHGGPTGRWSDTFEPWGQLLAARGYAVLYPNIRGSTGYGERFVELNHADWGGGDFKDVMAGVDWAIARGIADPARLAIGGWSYGGYMAAWAVTQTTRFKAAVSGAPVIDMASEFGTESGSAYDEWFYGLPYEKLEGFVKSSPITYVRKVKTPTLLLQGEADVTDPIGQSQQFYRGLKRYGVETELVLYPREGHGLREEKHLVDRLNRILAWYDRYVKGAARPSSP